MNDSGKVGDACALRSTLKAYEVYELACHDLNRLLPTIILSGEKYEELEPLSPDMV
jgi:hypothetical protein